MIVVFKSVCSRTEERSHCIDRRRSSIERPPPLCLKRRQPMKASFLFRTTPGQPPSLCSNDWTGASLSTILPFPSFHFLVKPPWEDLTLSSKSFDCLFVPLTVCLADTEVWSLQENELVLSLKGMYVQHKISIWLQLFRTYPILQCSIDNATVLLDNHLPR